MYYQKLTFGEGEYKITVMFNESSKINFVDENDEIIVSLDPSELSMLNSAYKDLVDQSHRSRIKKLEEKQYINKIR